MPGRCPLRDEDEPCEGPWWLAANVRTGHEQGVAERMGEFGVESYYPVETRTVRPARKRKPLEITKAALPGYLLVSRDTIADPEPIYRVPEFHYFVQFDKYLAKICQCMIEEMRTRELLGAFQVRFTSGPQFAIGEVIKVPDGPYKSYRGQVVAGPNSGHYCLDGLDFTRPVWFTALTLLRELV